jgi:hypothetical protein
VSNAKRCFSDGFTPFDKLKAGSPEGIKKPLKKERFKGRTTKNLYASNTLRYSSQSPEAEYVFC